MTRYRLGIISAQLPRLGVSSLALSTIFSYECVSLSFSLALTSAAMPLSVAVQISAAVPLSATLQPIRMCISVSRSLSLSLSLFLSRPHFGDNAAFSRDADFSGHAAFGGNAAFGDYGIRFRFVGVFVRVQSLLAPSPRAPMSEADWERRLRKRHAAVAHVKSTSDYRICEREDLLVEPPFEPGDRTVSKRKWEASIQLWRRALQQAADALATMPPSWVSL